MFNDSNLWCEDCEKSNAGECNQHGPLLIVPDSPVLSRARQSLPELLTLKEEEGQGISVYAKEGIKKRTRFGPLQARKGKLSSASEGRLQFKLFLEGKDPVCLDTNDEEYCNWMVFVQAARETQEQNLVAFQYQSDIYFVTTKDIEPNTELKVWYAKEYAFSMGVKPLSRISDVCPTESKIFRKLRSKEKKAARHSVSVSMGGIPSSSLSQMPVRKRSVKKFESTTTTSKEQHSKMTVLRKFTKSGVLTLGSEQLPEVLSQRLLKKSKKDQKNEENLQRYEAEASHPAVSSSSSGSSSSSLGLSKGGKHRCGICGKELSSPGKLSQHMYSHTGERPFQCDLCSKGFSSKFKLMRHVLIHSNERKHKCLFCERCFHRKDHLKNHMKVHNPNKKVYQCDKESCKKEYNSFLSFRKHIAVHAAEEGNLQCKICNKLFETKEEILYHLKVHAGSRTVKNPSEKKFKCEYCERKFFTRKDVKRHLVVHTGRRDFLCQFCPQRFGRKDHLVRHIKKSHARARSRRDVVKDEPTPSTSASTSILGSPMFLEDEALQPTSVLQSYPLKREVSVDSSDVDVLLAGPSSVRSSRETSASVTTPRAFQKKNISEQQQDPMVQSPIPVLHSLFYSSAEEDPPPPPYPSDIMDVKLYEDVKIEQDLAAETEHLAPEVDISQLINLIPSGNTSGDSVEPMESGVLSPQEGSSGISVLREHPQLDLDSIEDLGISRADAAALTHSALESQLLHLMQSSPSTLVTGTSSVSSPVSSLSAVETSSQTSTAISSTTMPSLLVPAELEGTTPSSSTPLPRFNQAFHQQQ